MAGFFLYTSNRMEHLADVLAEIVSVQRDSIFSPETIVVQNRGMQRWITLQLCNRLGIWSHCNYPFPDSFIRSLFSTVFTDIEQEPFNLGVLGWRIQKILPGFLDQKAFSELKTYLSDSKPLKLFELSNEIANLFNQYTVYRPEMILNWEQGHDDNWQAHLWRELSTGKTAHFATLKQLFFEQLSSGRVSANQFPERVIIFGISVLPPSYVEILEAISTLVDVHFFLLNPSAEYWDDILSSREISRRIKSIQKRQKKNVIKTELLHIDQGNPLLASLGQAGRSFLVNLHNITDEISFAVDPETSSNKPDSSTLLQAIQSDIFHLRNRADHSTPPYTISQSDKSIQIHSCHNPMRETEILYDNLLNMFENDNTLTPSDIVVMTPNIDLYAPFIKAVFNASCEDTKLKIPFSIADRSFKSESNLTEHFLTLLELPESRFTITSILGLLESPQIRSAFNINTQDLSKIRKWLINNNIRWGVDETALSSLGLIPEFSSNTWEAGINRLLLGYALPSNKQGMFNGIVGFDNIEGSDSDVLGNFLNFYTSLINFRKSLLETHTVSDWATLLSSSINSFFKALPENEHEIITLRNILYDLGKNATEAEFLDPIDIGLFRTAFSENISGINRTPGFITGGVTFCAMLPMRSIPFRVICLIGFNEDTFPRKSVFHSWDLIAQAPEPGDRSLQSEDRYLFLETILSARDIWYVSYVGSSNNGANSQKPSMMVDEVLDYIKNGYRVEISADNANDKNNVTSELSKSYTIIDHVVTQHKLQAFNPAYFKIGSNLFSYSQENYQAAILNKSNLAKRRPFFTDTLPQLSPEESELTSIMDLCRFFKNPSRFLLSHRCDIVFDESYEEVPENELFNLSGLDGYKISEYLTEMYIEGGSDNIQIAQTYLERSGGLPHGSMGKCSFKELSSETMAFTGKFSTVLQSTPLPDIQVSYNLDDNKQIFGTLNKLWEHYRLSFRCGNIKPTDFLESWINHLFLNAMQLEGYPVKSLLFTHDKSFVFNALKNYDEIIANLYKLFLRGQCEPLPFFPICSYTYANAIWGKNKSNQEALIDAKKKWYGDDKYNISAESRIPSNVLCFNEIDPFDDTFCEIALSVYEPIFECMEPWSIGEIS